MLNATDRTTELINHLLDISELEAGMAHMDRAPSKIEWLISKAVARARTKSPEHQLRAELKGDLPILLIDTRRIQQVLNNLLDNAIKYSAKDTEVVVRAAAKPEEVEISVTDQRKGIPAGEVTKIFERMHHLEHKLPEDPGGMRLGLHLCKALVEMHGGHIWGESAPGKGSTFHFTLPTRTPEEPLT